MQALAELTAKIVAAYVANHEVAPEDLADLITRIGQSLGGLSGQAESTGDQLHRRARVDRAGKSITNDYLICLEDGKRLKSMKLHLRTKFGLSPKQYREKWGLPIDYPMVAPNYGKKRSELAKASRLGKKPTPRAPINVTTPGR
jgi:predicted transcriptional regulator